MEHKQAQEKICPCIILVIFIILKLSMQKFLFIRVKSCIVTANCKYVVCFVHTVSEHLINKALWTSSTHDQSDELDVDFIIARLRAKVKFEGFVAVLRVKNYIRRVCFVNISTNAESSFVKVFLQTRNCKRRRLVCFVKGAWKHWNSTKDEVPFVLFEFWLACKHWPKKEFRSASQNFVLRVWHTSTSWYLY